MARKPRIHFPGAFYHVIARGNGKQNIFHDETDCQLYLKLLSEYKERLQFFLYAYVLMPNHFHLLIEVRENPLSQLMHGLLFRYTRRFNSRYRKSGHLFQGRYQAIVCEKDTYFLELSAYIHLNPVRAGLVKNPSDYQWSSCRSYMSKGEDSLVDRDFLLVQFSKRKSSARKLYNNFVMSRINSGHRADLYQLKDQRFIGAEEFIEDVHRNLNEELPVRYDISIMEIASHVGSIFQIESDLLYSQTRNRKGAWGRAMVGYLGRKLSRYKNREIAEHFKRDPEVMSASIRKLEERLRKDNLFAQKMEMAEHVLIHQKKKKYLIT